MSAEQQKSVFGTNVMMYTLKDAEGYDRKFSSGSVALAREMLKHLGKKVKITKTGEAAKTKYEVVEAIEVKSV